MNNNTPTSSVNSNHPAELPSSSSSSSTVVNSASSKSSHKVNGTDDNSFSSTNNDEPSSTTTVEGVDSCPSRTRSNNEHSSCNTCQLQQQRNGCASSTTPETSSLSLDVRNQEDAKTNSGNSSGNNANVVAIEDESTEEDDCGDSDDQYCVYTYKGDGSSQQPSRLAADLPSSFFKFHPSDSSSCPPSSSSSEIPSLEPSSSSSRCCHSSSRLQNSLNPGGVERNNINPNNNEMYSPDMDFLEMDFDPGGSGDGCCDADTEEDSEDTVVRSHLYPDPGVPVSSDRFNFGRNLATASGGSNNGNFHSSSSVNNNPNPMLNSDDHASAAVVLSKLVVTRSNFEGVAGPSSTSLLDCTSTTQRSERTLEPVAHCSKKRVMNSNNNSSEISSSCSSSTGGGNNTSSVMNPLMNEIKLRLVKSVTFPEIGSSSSSFSRITGESASANNCNNHSNSRAMAMSVSAPVFQNKLEQPCPTVIPAGKSSEDTMELEVDGVMIWSIQEAQEISINQIGRSACGATGCLNVLSALGCIMTTLSPEFVNNCVGTRLRAEDADLPEYLLSRSNAGATHADLIAGIHRASNGLIYGRFFQIKPDTLPSTLNKWLLHWICKGAVPIATLNRQIRRPGEFHNEIPDAWHHQMIFGVMRQGIFLTNPLECVPTAELLPQLSSQSVLLVRRDDVTKRTGPRTDLRKLARFSNPSWNEMNVLGQVSNMLLEEMPVLNGSAGLARRTRTSHVSIPACYKAGISLFIRESNSTSCALLKDAPEF